MMAEFARPSLQRLVERVSGRFSFVGKGFTRSGRTEYTPKGPLSTRRLARVDDTGVTPRHPIGPSFCTRSR